MLPYRITDVDFVHVDDDAADASGRSGPTERWYRAAGQPQAASRVRVRPLSVDDWRSVISVGDASPTQAMDQVALAASIGLVSIDGDAVAIEDVVFGLAQDIGSLVIALSINPTHGRSSSSTAGPSTDSSGTVPSAA